MYFEGRRHRRGSLLPSWMLWALLLTGCDAGQKLSDRDLMWIWLAIPLAGIGCLGGIGVWTWRNSQLNGWQLDKDPRDPEIRPLILSVALGTVALAVGFIVFTYPYWGDRQTLQNIGLWCLGSIGGGASALQVGLYLAESKKR